AFSPQSSNRQRTRQNLNLVRFNANGILKQGAGWRAGSDAAVGVEDAAMARAHKKIGAGQPADRTTQMSAIHRKCDELVFADAAEPGCGLCGYAGPRQR